MVGKEPCFLQAFRQLDSLPAEQWKMEEQPFDVVLKGEGAEDAGGPCMNTSQPFKLCRSRCNGYLL